MAAHEDEIRSEYNINGTPTVERGGGVGGGVRVRGKQRGVRRHVHRKMGQPFPQRGIPRKKLQADPPWPDPYGLMMPYKGPR